MSAYRKKPVVIEAVQFDGSFPLGFLSDDETVRWSGVGQALEVTTLEGVMRAEVGDWLIRGVAGEFYPCKPDIFDASYEAAGDV